MEGKHSARWLGRTRINKLVFVEAQAELRGDLVQVKIEQSGPWSLRASLRRVRQPLERPVLSLLAVPSHPQPSGDVS